MAQIKSYFRIRYHLFRIMLKNWRKTWGSLLFPILWGAYNVFHHNWIGLVVYFGVVICGVELALHSSRKGYEKRKLKTDIIRFLKNECELEVIEVPVGSI